ncbi:hypothetical protein QTP88_021505 [Uroleucon formosanum]
MFDCTMNDLPPYRNRQAFSQDAGGIDSGVGCLGVASNIATESTARGHYNGHLSTCTLVCITRSTREEKKPQSPAQRGIGSFDAFYGPVNIASLVTFPHPSPTPSPTPPGDRPRDNYKFSAADATVSPFRPSPFVLAQYTNC